MEYFDWTRHPTYIYPVLKLQPDLANPIRNEPKLTDRFPNFATMATDLQTSLFINGSYVPSSSGETLTIHNPADDSLVSDKVQVASEVDVDRAVDAARSAFPAWRNLAGHKRAACMFKFAELLEREAGRLAGLGA